MENDGDAQTADGNTALEVILIVTTHRSCAIMRDARWTPPVHALQSCHVSTHNGPPLTYFTHAITVAAALAQPLLPASASSSYTKQAYTEPHQKTTLPAPRPLKQ